MGHRHLAWLIQPCPQNDCQSQSSRVQPDLHGLFEMNMSMKRIPVEGTSSLRLNADPSLWEDGATTQGYITQVDHKGRYPRATQGF